MSRRNAISIALLLATGAATAVAQSMHFYASQDIPVANGGIVNDYTYTYASDNQYEGITELRTGGAPYEKRTYLIHKWAVPVDGIYDSWAFHLEAHHTLTDGYGADDFIFAWSPDDLAYHRMLTVTKTVDDNTYQASRFYPPPDAATIYIRVTDTVPNGFKGTDTIYVDHMYIHNYADLEPPVVSDVRAETVTGPAWVHMSPEVSPGTLEGREYHAMAYDSTAHKTILFGGRDEQDYLADTWAYDYATNNWHGRTPEVVGGQLDIRVGHAMVYDSAKSKTIMFGGFGGGHYEGDEWIPNWQHNDTWIYDYAANTWTNANPDVTGGLLDGRWQHAMAYDPVADLTIMVGGDYSGVSGLREAWVYNYDDNRWYNMTPTMQVIGGEFQPRWGHCLAYDSGAARTIMFGGWTPDGESNETWAYDSTANAWYNMTPTMNVVGGPLTPRARHVLVYDSAAGEVILFGGEDGSGEQLGDTWAYTFGDNTWRRVNPSIAGGALLAREEPASAYDSANSATILFGGFGNDEPFFLGDTWMYTHEPAAVITWRTDELSNSLVRYGTDTPPAAPVANGTMVVSHSVVLRSLMAYPTYYYYEVQATDIGSNTTLDDNGGVYYTFTIGVPNNGPEPPGDPSPADGATDVGLDVNLSVYVSDPDADDLDVSFYDESAGLIGIDYAVPSGTRASMLGEGLSPATEYGWYAVADDSEASTQSQTWHFTTTASSPGGMYVWDISWRRRQSGPNTFLTHIVTVRYDSDQDGVAEPSDALVSDATVYSTLTHTATDESWGFSGVTENGVVEFTQKVTSAGEYQAEVTNITHGTYGYTPDMDVDNPDFYSVP